MKAMVLAAGAGSRMGELTRNIPKPMLDVNGSPILAHILRNLVRHGFQDVVFNLHFHPQSIQSYFGDGSAFGARITYVHEASLLGTAGSVGHAAAHLTGQEPILVHYGDVLTDQDFGAMLTFHLQKKARATLLLHQRSHSNSIVVLSEEGRITRLLERPDEASRKLVNSPWVNSGIYLLDPSVLELLPTDQPWDFPRDVFPGLIDQGEVFGFPLTGYRCAIDSPERLEKARSEWSLGRH